MNNEQLLLDQFLINHPKTAINTIEEYAIDDIVQFLESLTPAQGMSILTGMSPYLSGKVFEKMAIKHAIDLVDLMSLQSAKTMLRGCEKTFYNQVLAGLPSGKERFLSKALSYEKSQVGAHIEPINLVLKSTITFEKALLLLKRSEEPLRTHVFVTNEEQKLLGYVEVTEFFKSPPDRMVKAMMRPIPMSVYAEMNVKDLLDRWPESFPDLPVVDNDGLFLGVVSRAILLNHTESRKGGNKAIIKTGNALGELYAIGLTGLLGSADTNKK